MPGAHSRGKRDEGNESESQNTMTNKQKMIIVESRAKTQSIGKILGDGYKVTYCLGHVYDLPEKDLGIDVNSEFKPVYKMVSGKSKLIKQLKDEAKEVDEVILATDPDREGESIAWHLARLFPHKKIYRMSFNEITEKAIREAMGNLKDINMNLVDAQQARRVMDRLVGYKLSPLLWRNLNNSRLSAGRVQSVALRLICEREREIEKFDPIEYWTLTGVFDSGPRAIVFQAGFIGLIDEEIKIPNEEASAKLLEILRGLRYKVHSVQKKTEKRRAQPPFITSTLQQEASRRLRFSASKTMAIAQQLYEGIELGSEGNTGLITYMRTDSTRVSEDAQREAREFISTQYGDSYLPEKSPVYKSKSGAQDAHEAIRPAYITRSVASISQYLSKDQQQLYDLIWSRFIASQMAPAIVDITRIDIAGDDKYIFRATGSVIKFDGFLKIMNYASKDNDTPEEEKPVPAVEEGDILDLKDLLPEQHFTKPPARYTEASLVRELEERGIGRPSTYVPTIETLKKRDYVALKKRSFTPTQWGFRVNDILTKNFGAIVDYEFTAHMEEELDQVESGGIVWQNIVGKFYDPFDQDIKKAMKSMKFTDEKCEKCGAELVLKSGRYGAFLGCSKYPDCDFTKPLANDTKTDPAEKKPPVATGEKCEKCGADMVMRQSRFGSFVACSAYPKCKNKKSYTPEFPCPREGCDGKIIKRKARKGRSFYGCTKYPDCNFISWLPPVEGSACPDCGSFMVAIKHENRNALKCSRDTCAKIVLDADSDADEE